MWATSMPGCYTHFIRSAIVFSRHLSQYIAYQPNGSPLARRMNVIVQALCDLATHLDLYPMLGDVGWGERCLRLVGELYAAMTGLFPVRVAYRLRMLVRVLRSAVERRLGRIVMVVYAGCSASLILLVG